MNRDSTMFRRIAGMLFVWLSLSLCDCAALAPSLARSASASEPMRKSARRVDVPPMLVAPFSRVAARERQTAWANHLKTEIQITNSIGSTLILIPAGEFRMGSHESMEETAAFAISMGYKDARAESYRDEHPQHQVQ